MYGFGLESKFRLRNTKRTRYRVWQAPSSSKEIGVLQRRQHVKAVYSVPMYRGLIGLPSAGRSFNQPSSCSLRRVNLQRSG